jgi:rubrerythrin
VDILALLDRCVGLERSAAELYELLGRRFAGDAELVALWRDMAAAERGHARKLATWRELVAAEPPEHRPQASGFVADVEAVEAMLRTSLAAAVTADQEEAFALALALETSELDAIYTILLQSSPLSRYPDFATTVRYESAGHHQTLLTVAERRCRSEQNQLRIALLAAHGH